MVQLLYAIKIALLQKELSKISGFFTSITQATRIRDFVTFITLIYSSWWISCSQSVYDPYNDLKQWRHLGMYHSINATIAATAQRAFLRHLWYLTPEMVPLSLFSSHVPDEERQALGSCLLAVKPEVLLGAPAESIWNRL